MHAHYVHPPTLLLVVLLTTLVAVVSPARATPAATVDRQQVFLPAIRGVPLPPAPFGFDLRYYTSDDVLAFAQGARPRWARAGEVFWSDVEPVRGEYRWEALANIDRNVRRLRAAGIEPTLIIQRSPEWAQSIPGRLCSPMKPEYIDDFARFTAAVVKRYSSDDLQVHYWEIWNEPDFAPEQVQDIDGTGCWADPQKPHYGGSYYGEVLKRVYPAIKAANPDATVLGGALAYFWPDDTVSRSFLEGMLAVGAGDAIDGLSFHAYGDWGAADLLLNKTNRIREILREYNQADKALFATEIAATCRNDDKASCWPNYEQWKMRQANYAARIYAEAIALDLKGAFWYTLTLENPGFRYSHLIDREDGKLLPRPSYYAFRNSALLLQGARYFGPPLVDPPPDQIDKVQKLLFRKQNSTLDPSRGSVLYVLWVPRIDMPNTSYKLLVHPGATALCSQTIEQYTDGPHRFYCNDTNNDGIIWLAVNSFPQYVEVIDP